MTIISIFNSLYIIYSLFGLNNLSNQDLGSLKNYNITEILINGSDQMDFDQSCPEFLLSGSSFEEYIGSYSSPANQLTAFPDISKAPPFSAVNGDGDIWATSINNAGTTFAPKEGNKFIELLQNDNGYNELEWWNEESYTDAINQSGSFTYSYDRIVVIQDVNPNTNYSIDFWHKEGGRLNVTHAGGGQTLLQVQSMQTDDQSYQLYDPTVNTNTDANGWSPESYQFTTDNSTTQVAILFSAYAPNLNVSIQLDAINISCNVLEDSSEIKLNGTVSAENHQIKNVVDPTDAQDAATKSYVEDLLKEYQSQINNLQEQIDALQAVNNSGTVTDQDGNSYPYLTYGDQVWTVKNAEMVTYRDGTPIPQVTDTNEWINLTTGAWCYPENNESYGKFYNWYAVAGIHDNDEDTPNKEFAPEGWHVPSDAEWTELENYLITNGYNFDSSIGTNKIAKSLASVEGWHQIGGFEYPGNQQQHLNNKSGFNAFPAGFRSNGESGYSGKAAFFWCSDDQSLRYLEYHRRELVSSSNYPQFGISVRLIRD